MFQSSLSITLSYSKYVSKKKFKALFGPNRKYYTLAFFIFFKFGSNRSFISKINRTYFLYNASTGIRSSILLAIIVWSGKENMVAP